MKKNTENNKEISGKLKLYVQSMKNYVDNMKNILYEDGLEMCGKYEGIRVRL